MEYDWDDYGIYPPEIKRGFAGKSPTNRGLYEKSGFPLPCWIDRGYSLHSSAMDMTVMGVNFLAVAGPNCRPWRFPNWYRGGHELSMTRLRCRGSRGFVPNTVPVLRRTSNDDFRII